MGKYYPYTELMNNDELPRVLNGIKDVLDPKRLVSPVRWDCADGRDPLGKFGIYTPVNSDLDNVPELEFPFVPGSRFRAVNTGVNEPGCQINYEDFYWGLGIHGRWRMMKCRSSSPAGRNWDTTSRH